MPENKTPEEMIEELKTGIGALAEMTYMFFMSLVTRGMLPNDAITITCAFIKGISESMFKKGDSM